MEEVSAIYSGMEMFVDPNSNIIKSVGAPVHCNNMALPGTSKGVNGTAAAIQKCGIAMSWPCC
jgi:hypothetical protein